METIQIRLPEGQLKKIDKEIKKGAYKSRSDAIRDYLARMEFLSMFNEFQEIADESKIDKKKLMQAISSARGKFYKKYL